ncbi:hypothetical protein Cantr_09236 [Candida viswanathii]|uniref:Myosin-binding domain-containing protein n=1 Tax=Candida viswanathii TaxID=5486 RepID=A0A367Y900_9ASCO|nr:hypothetical protein Cantr_09236 [Candida viswanathii]
MNFDRLNPLSSYLFPSSKNTPNNDVSTTKNKLKETLLKPINTDLQLDSEISDWGIENPTQPNSKSNTSANGLLLSPSVTSTSTTTTTAHNENHHVGLNYHQIHEDLFLLPPPQAPFVPRLTRAPYQSHRKFSTALANSQNSQRDFQYYYDAYVLDHILPSTENISKFICKYLSLEHKLGEFWEKFKYNLIVSSLLEDSMALSKNEANLQTLSKTSIADMRDASSDVFGYSFNDDGTRLFVLDRQYKLCYNLKYNNMKIIVLVINMIIFLLKQQQLYYNQVPGYLPLHLQLRMFKIIVYISVKLIKFRKFKIIINSTRILQNLQQFLMLNYKINKRLIIYFNNLRGEQLNLIPNKDHRSVLSHLVNSLEFLNLNLQSSIIKLLPYLNGNLFEQYCTINNVNLDVLNKDVDVHEDEKNSAQVIGKLINKFDNLRKLFICQLLTINEPLNPNFFVFRLMDDFEMGDAYQPQQGMTDLSRLSLVYEILTDHNSTLTNIEGLFEKFEDLNKGTEVSSREADSGLPSQLNLDTLIARLSNLTTNLKYFQKYNRSIENLDNMDEQQEKLMIFSQFKDELEHVKTLYKSSLFDLNRELNPGYMVPPSPSSASNVSGSPKSAGQSFNLKSFQNSSLKKRFSLPPPQSLPTPTTPTTPSNVTSNNNNTAATTNNNNTKDKKYKRLSTGLQLGLLTVFENDQTQNRTPNRNSTTSLHSRSSSKTNNNVTSYDDNYLNILPPASYETYNQKSLEALNKRMRNSNGNGNHNRYSLNSVQSNISGITDLISTNLTSYGEEEETGQQGNGNHRNSNGGQHPLSKEDLKLRLEESFNRIYSLENENKLLKKNLNGDASTQEEENDDLASITKPNPQFLSELEMKLSK